MTFIYETLKKYKPGRALGVAAQLIYQYDPPLWGRGGRPATLSLTHWLGWRSTAVHLVT